MAANRAETQQRRNLKKAITRFIDQIGHYYVLDNAAVIMPAVSDHTETFLFRLSATLDHPIRVQAMHLALLATARRFPYFMVELRRGLFWYYLQPLNRAPRLEPDSPWPCLGFNVHRRGQFMFRVRLHGARVACEFNHALTDGTGGLAFLRCLLVQYFEQLGLACPDPGDVARPGEPIDDEEFEDAYHRYYKPGIPGPLPLPRAFHIDSPPLASNQYRITAARIPLAELSALAKSYRVTMTELLVAALLEAWLEEYRSSNRRSIRKSGHSISVEVPVNMRKFYPTRSLRNFSLYVMVCLDARLGAWSFDELVAYVHHVMRVEVDERMIARQISRNAGSLRNIFVRLTPLFVKDFFGRIFFNLFGQAGISTFISNLGPVSLPEPIAARVRRFDFIPAPNMDTRTNASVLSWQDSMYINFGSRVRSRSIERRFFQRLAGLGLPVFLDPVEED